MTCSTSQSNYSYTIVRYHNGTGYIPIVLERTVISIVRYSVDGKVWERGYPSSVSHEFIKEPDVVWESIEDFAKNIFVRARPFMGDAYFDNRLKKMALNLEERVSVNEL